MTSKTSTPPEIRVNRHIMVALSLFAAGVSAVLLFSCLRDPSDFDYVARAGMKDDRIVAERSEIEKLPTRKEFEALIGGKTQEEVIGLIGRPDRTDPPGDIWHYHRTLCYDPISMKPDAYIILEFFQNKVVGINL